MKKLYKKILWFLIWRMIKIQLKWETKNYKFNLYKLEREKVILSKSIEGMKKSHQNSLNELMKENFINENKRKIIENNRNDEFVFICLIEILNFNLKKTSLK